MTAWEMYGWGLVGIWGMMTVLWVASIPLRNVSIVDIFWGLGFVGVNGWFYAAGEGDPVRKGLLLVLVTVWGLRLSGYLAWRNIGKGEDFRYQEFRRQYGEGRYWWLSYFQVFLLQGVLMGVIALPLAMGMGVGYCEEWMQYVMSAKNLDGANTIGTACDLNALDYAGIGVWCIGFLFEAGGDWQLARFKAHPAHKGKVMDRGFWRYTRHPNYFGDAMVWWGYGLVSVGAGVLWGLVGSVVMTLLLVKVSGVALLEKSLKEEKPGYADYVRRTNAFIPWWPRKD
jgi:steroid 5-alpha reductase family enzyme